MKLKKVVSLFSAVIIGLTANACNAKESNGEGSPDYSMYDNKFDFYAYGCPNDGTYKIDGETYSVGEDFRTEARIKEYKDAGMTIYFPQSSAQITYADPEKEWEDAKVIWDYAVNAGFEKKIIMRDVRILMLSNGQLNPGKDPNYKDKEGIIGEGKQFASEKELDEEIYSYLSLYKDHPGFMGVMLVDEPVYDVLVPYSQVYNSIKRVSEKYGFDCFIQYNLLPLRSASKDNAFSCYPLLDGFDSIEEEIAHYGEGNLELSSLAYEKYISSFVDALKGVEYILFDDYPLRESGVLKEYVLGMQIVAKIAKEKGVKFYNVTQTFAGDVNGKRDYREISKEDAAWLNNMLMVFGVKQIAYYTYFTHTNNSTKGLTHIDGTSFISRNGEKTELYGIMQDIMAQNQIFAPTILNFDYQDSKVVIKTPTSSKSQHADWAIKDCEFTKIKGVQVNKEYALISELYDSKNNNYMYAVQNIVDTTYKGSKYFQTTTLTFDEKEYDFALVYRNGESTIQKLEKGVILVKNAPGEAAFVIPYKSK